jgi:hypothetical protein
MKIFVVEMRVTHEVATNQEWAPYGYVYLTALQGENARQRLAQDRRRTNVEFRLVSYKREV